MAPTSPKRLCPPGCVGGCPVARNPGQTRFEVLIDHGGTPADPEDDEFLEFLGVVKESTGRTDDFCAAVVPELVG